MEDNSGWCDMLEDAATSVREAMARKFREEVFGDTNITEAHEENLDNPKYFSLGRGTASLDIPLTASPTSPVIAAWHMVSGTPDPKKPFVVYLHGINESRAYGHRVSLYKTLLKAGYSILAIDYRGFADSTEIDITEATVVEDAKRAVQYARSELGQKNVLVWGHSMGTGIASHMMAEQDLAGFTKVRLLLESPYNNLRGQALAMVSPYGQTLSAILGLVGTALLERTNMQFESSEWLPKVSCPVLILHASDDEMIPADLSRQLFEEAKEKKEDVSRVLFQDFGFGHNNIWRYDGLAELVERFWNGTVPTEDTTVVSTALP